MVAKKTPSRIKVAVPKGTIKIGGVKVSRAKLHKSVFDSAVEGFGATPTADDQKLVGVVDDLITKVMKSSKAIKAVLDLDLDGKVVEDVIQENRSLKIQNFEEFKETLWYGSLNYTFTAFADLVALTVGHDYDIGSRPAYVSLSDAVYRVIGSFIVPASQDLGSAFALEHGAEDALRECVYKLHASGKLACRIRFIKARNMPVTRTPVYEEIKIQFGKEYSLRITAKHYRY